MKPSHGWQNNLLAQMIRGLTSIQWQSAADIFAVTNCSVRRVLVTEYKKKNPLTILIVFYI